MKNYYRVQANINLDCICNNVKRIKEIIKEDTKIMAIIKADGYGHGAVPIAKVLEQYVDGYGLAIIEEAIELRNAGIKKPLLILGCTPEAFYKDLMAYDIMPSIYQYNMAKKLSEESKRQNKITKIHIKVDTGMNRIGFMPTDENVEVIKQINQLEGIEIAGCFSHFARADEIEQKYTKIQIETYLKFIEKLEKAGIEIPVKHISNSAGIMEYPEANFDMVRGGISMYGLYPSEEVHKENLYLEPAMEIKAFITNVKEVEAGVGVSYNSTFITKKKTKIATIPVGYGDGYPRALSNKGRVLIHGKSAPILGRVCMDQFMVDVSEIHNVIEGDVAILLGRDREEFISVEELTDQMEGSNNYEFVCDVGKRIPRVYYLEGNKVGTSDFYHYNNANFNF